VSASASTLQDVASVDDFLNVAAIETVPLFEHLEFEFLLEHEFTSHQTSSEAFCTATTRMSTEHARLHENFRTALSGTTADSTNRHPETRLTAFSPTSNTLLTMSSTDSSSRPPPAACSTPRTPSIRHTLKPFNTTTRRYGTTIQRLRSTTTASAVRSSRPVQRSQ